jgi:hypothetical protein
VKATLNRKFLLVDIFLQSAITYVIPAHSILSSARKLIRANALQKVATIFKTTLVIDFLQIWRCRNWVTILENRDQIFSCICLCLCLCLCLCICICTIPCVITHQRLSRNRGRIILCEYHSLMSATSGSLRCEWKSWENANLVRRMKLRKWLKRIGMTSFRFRSCDEHLP